MRLLPSSSIALGVAWLLAAATASAQTPRPERPYRGLFGSDGGTGNTQQWLVFRGSAGGSLDDNLVADALAISGNRPVRGTGDRGPVGLLSGTLSSHVIFDRVTVGASLGTGVRYYPSFTNEQVVRRHRANVGASVRLTKGLSAHAAATYQPHGLWSLFPGLSQPGSGEMDSADLDFIVKQHHYVSYETGASFAQRVSRRVSVGANYDFRKAESAVSRRPFTAQQSAGHVTLNAGKGLDLRAGYAYADGRYASTDRGSRFTSQTVDTGLAYNRPLSFSRRTTLSFNTGTAATTHADITHYYLTGSARVNREIGRTWNASVAYDRNVRFVETFDQPVFADAVTLGLAGLVTRRVSVRSSAHATTGRLGFAPGDHPLRSYSATGGMQIGVSRFVAVSVDYSYAEYRFDPGVPLPAGWTHDLHRQRIEGNVNLWAPLIERARKDDASR